MAPPGSYDFLIQLLPLVLVWVLSIIPSIRLLGRVGKSKAWALLALWPLVGLLMLVWIVAYSRWEQPQTAQISH
jgi:hypothetical protein